MSVTEYVGSPHRRPTSLAGSCTCCKLGRLSCTIHHRSCLSVSAERRRPASSTDTTIADKLLLFDPSNVPLVALCFVLCAALFQSDSSLLAHTWRDSCSSLCHLSIRQHDACPKQRSVVRAAGQPSHRLSLLLADVHCISARREGERRADGLQEAAAGRAESAAVAASSQPIAARHLASYRSSANSRRGGRRGVDTVSHRVSSSSPTQLPPRSTHVAPRSAAVHRPASSPLSVRPSLLLLSVLRVFLLPSWQCCFRCCPVPVVPIRLSAAVSQSPSVPVPEFPPPAGSAPRPQPQPRSTARHAALATVRLPSTVGHAPLSLLSSHSLDERPRPGTAVGCVPVPSAFSVPLTASLVSARLVDAAAQPGPAQNGRPPQTEAADEGSGQRDCNGRAAAAVPSSSSCSGSGLVGGLWPAVVVLVVAAGLLVVAAEFAAAVVRCSGDRCHSVPAAVRCVAAALLAVVHGRLVVVAALCLPSPARAVAPVGSLVPAVARSSLARSAQRR